MTRDIDGLSVLTLNLLRRVVDAEVERKAVSLFGLVFTYYLICIYI